MYLRGYAGKKNVKKRRREQPEPGPQREQPGLAAILGRSQKLLRFLLRFMAFLALLWAALLLGRHIIYRTDYFKINDLVVSGIEDQDKVRQIILYSGITPREYLFRVDIPEILERMKKLPFIKSSDIQVDARNNLVFKLGERQGAFLIRGSDNRFAILDRERTVIRLTDSPDDQEMKLPLITGIDTSEAQAGQILENPGLEAAQNWLDVMDEASKTEMAELSVKSPFEVWVIFQNGDTVKGDVASNYRARSAELTRLRRYLTRKGFKTAYIDIRYDIGFVVKGF